MKKWNKYWCLRLGPNPNRLTNIACRPIMTSIWCFDDVTVLGSTLPRVPTLPNAKDAIKQIRNSRIKTYGRRDASGRQIFDMEKTARAGQDYGHCAET
jgi:hypothetical protein